MNIKELSKPQKNFFQKARAKFESLQEMNFERSEKKLKELIEREEGSIDYPIPIFVPVLLVWLFIILFPFVLILDPGFMHDQEIDASGLLSFYYPLLMTLIIFQLNEKYFVPSCIFKKHYAMYFVWNFFTISIALFLREIAFFLIERNPGEGVVYFFRTYCFSIVKGHFSIGTVVSFMILVCFVCFICVVYHVMIRQILKTFIRREQKKMDLQYELDFLKNQLSPHFLFNTLNNISALIQIDPKRAEKSMEQLSKLLRVMLYQGNDQFITLKEDSDVLLRYADLEKLRLEENFDLKFDVQLENPERKIEPFIVMPLMENAMKHCVNPRGGSFAHISYIQKGNELFFHAENSNFPRKATSQKKSSGLGLATFNKRLELIYANRYKYTTRIENGTFITDLHLFLKTEEN